MMFPSLSVSHVSPVIVQFPSVGGLAIPTVTESPAVDKTAGGEAAANDARLSMIAPTIHVTKIGPSAATHYVYSSVPGPQSRRTQDGEGEERGDLVSCSAYRGSTCVKYPLRRLRRREMPLSEATAKSGTVIGPYLSLSDPTVKMMGGLQMPLAHCSARTQVSRSLSRQVRHPAVATNTSRATQPRGDNHPAGSSVNAFAAGMVGNGSAPSWKEALSLGGSSSSAPRKPVRSSSRSRSAIQTTHISEYPRGVRYGSQGPRRKGRKHLGADDQSLAVYSTRLTSEGQGANALAAYPSARERSRARSIAGHGLMGTPSVSGVSLVVLLTNADPDAVKGASELQRSHCPAFNSNPGASAMPMGRARSGHMGDVRIAVSTAEAGDAAGTSQGPLGVTDRRDGHFQFGASPYEKRRLGASGGQASTDPETSSSPGRRMGGVSRNRGVTARRDGNQFNSNGGRTRLRPVTDAVSGQFGIRGGKRAVQSIRMDRRQSGQPLIVSGEGGLVVTQACAGVDLQFSSGDGLGIHQPRSADSRLATKRVERQGRARDRVICPAVTRSSSSEAKRQRQYADGSKTSDGFARSSSRGDVEGHIRSLESNAATFTGHPVSSPCMLGGAAGIKPVPRETLSNLITYPFGGGE